MLDVLLIFDDIFINIDMNIMPERLLRIFFTRLPPEIGLAKVQFVESKDMLQLLVFLKVLQMLLNGLSFHSLVFRHLEY